MFVVRTGVAPVKGTAHPSLPSVELGPDGPVDDRVFCFVDPATGKVLRTVEEDALLACRARWEPPVLTLSTPSSGEVSVAVGPTGTRRTGEYWARRVELVDVDGPFADLMSRHLGRDVVLCRALPGDVVWGASVSLATTSSLAELARRIGSASDDGARFRPTFVIDTGDLPPFAEDGWAGRRLRVGDAVVTVRGPMPRCAVVDRTPGAGGVDARVLKALAPDRTRGGEIWFGVDASVEVPGRVAVGAPVVLGSPVSGRAW